MYGRQMPWRHIDDPYRIAVSEIMLQQTQVDRVRVKYAQFLERFPTLESLAAAPLADVLRVWQGLGYNRRAKFLKSMAQIIVSTYGGDFPRDPSVLKTLPGIGPGTAGSISAFAFNAPSVFIETNIRRVFIHFFFSNQAKVADKDILPLVARTVDVRRAREWYYALMDYGTLLAKTQINPNRRSKHYARQSRFEGSDRQVRGKILKELLSGPAPRAALAQSIRESRTRIDPIVDRLIAESFIVERNNNLSLSYV